MDFQVVTVDAYLGNNMYKVRSQSSKAPGTAPSLIATGPQGTAVTGTSLSSVYPNGTVVLACLPPGGVDDMWCIVAPVSVLLTSAQLPASVLLADQKVLDLFGKLSEAIACTYGSLQTAADKSNGLPYDALPGDAAGAEKTGPGMLIGKHVMHVQAAPDVHTDWDAVLGRVRSVYRQKSEDSPVRSTQQTYSGGDALTVDQQAVDVREGMGYLSPDSVDPAAPVRPMIPRKLSISGLFVRGFREYVSVPVTYGKAATVSEVSTDLDGSIAVKSAKSVSLEKTLYIVRPEPDGDVSVSAVSGAPDIVGEKEGASGKGYIKNSPLNYDAGLIKDASYTLPGVYANGEHWKITDPIDGFSGLERDTVLNPQLTPIGSRPGYTMPQALVVQDPRTGQKYQYFASNSFIKILDDGSIILTDGYGSQIYMTGGNIYLSPAVDLVGLSGRDTHLMSGRHTAVKAQQKIQINSSKDSLQLCAQKNLELLGGASGAGSVLLEGRGEGDKALVVKAPGVVITGRNIGIILNTAKNVTSGTLTPASAGVLTLDAGGGALTLQGGLTTLSGKSVTVAAHEGSAGSVFSMTPSSYALQASSVSLYGSSLWFTKPDSLLTLSVLGPDGPVTVTAAPGTGAPTARFGGVVLADGSISSNRDVVAFGGVYGRSGGFGNASNSSALKINTSQIKKEDIGTARIAPPTTYNYTELYRTIWQDSVVVGNRFIFPSSTELGVASSGYTLVGSRWQTFLSTPRYWTESALRDIVGGETTMVYPGAEAWSSGLISVAGSSEGVSTETGVIINS